MLKAEATDMKVLPIQFDFTFAEEAKIVYSTLKSRQPCSVEAELATNEHISIDRMVSSYFGIEKYNQDIQSTLLDLVYFRCNRAQQ